VIVEICRAASEGLLVVTSDRELGRRVEAEGAEVMKTKRFHEALMSAKFGAPPDDPDDDAPRTGTKKKGPARRPKKRDRARERRERKL